MIMEKILSVAARVGWGGGGGGGCVAANMCSNMTVRSPLI